MANHGLTLRFTCSKFARMDNRKRVLEYIAIQQAINKEVWPKYVQDSRRAMSFDEVCLNDEMLEHEFARRLGTTPHPHRIECFAERSRAHMMAFFNQRCAYCQHPFPWEVRANESGYGLVRLQIHREHVHAKSDGGVKNRQNIVPACPRCNWSKGKKPIEIWMPPSDTDPLTGRFGDSPRFGRR